MARLPTLRREQRYRKTLSCYHFPDFMVKEYSESGKGAEWLAILPSRGKLPEYGSSHGRGERVIEISAWSGYFKGVKGSLVFFDAADSANGALPLANYDSVTGKKIFEDSAYDQTAWMKDKRPPFSCLRVTPTKLGFLVRYHRVTEAGCVLRSEGRDCWKALEAKLALKNDEMAICREYEDIAEQVESMIACPVGVTLSPHPAPMHFPGPLECWPVN